MTDEEMTEIERAISRYYGQREIYLLMRRQIRKTNKKINREVHIEQLSKDGFDPKKGKLIRQDSSDSIIEII